MASKKELCVVFPYFAVNSEEVWILLCRNFKLGFLNGFGGKIEDSEKPEEGALRELGEELRIQPLEERLKEVGTVKDGLKTIFINLYEIDEKITPDPNPAEISETGWYKLSERADLLGEMLSGDGEVLDRVDEILGATLRGEPLPEPFFIDKTGDALLEEQTRNVYS
jgi:ADP-ribose pyrophosphatase YjhB (NUDIX family)